MKAFFKQSSPIGISKFYFSVYLHRIHFIPMIIILGLLSTDSLASQSDQRLDSLFNRLQTTLNEVEAQRIEIKIWEIWIESDRKEVHDLMQRGTSAMAKPDYETAFKIFDKVVAIAPDFAEGWNKRATVHYLRKDFAASIKDIQRTLKLEPRHFGALSGLGLIFVEMEKYDSALTAFEDALKINPHLRGAKANAGAIRKFLGIRKI